MTALNAQCLATVEEARKYLLDQGHPTDNFNLLHIHMNAITSFILQTTGRDRIKWIDADTIEEYRNGYGEADIFLKNAPIVRVVSVQTWPNDDSQGDTYTGPTEPAVYNDDMEFDAVRGMLRMKGATLPDHMSGVKISYEAGFVAADHEYDSLKLITLDALARKWNRWKSQRHGIESESKQETTVTYSDADFPRFVMKDLHRFRRTLFA